jgi:hypothetical protein
VRYAILYRESGRGAWELLSYHAGTWREASTSAEATILQDRTMGVARSEALVVEDREWDRYVGRNYCGRPRAKWRSRGAIGKAG